MKKVVSCLMVKLIFISMLTLVLDVKSVKASGTSDLCNLTIIASSGGTTNPTPGTYTVSVGSLIEVTAIPNIDSVFWHWELDFVNIGTDNPYRVLMDKHRTLMAVFSGASTIYLSPSSTTVGAGQLFTIEINIADAPTMDFCVIRDVTWNPAVVELEHGTKADIELGPFMKSFGEPWFQVKDPEPGWIEDIGSGFFEKVQANGNGTLFIIKFRAKAVGTTEIKIGSAGISDMKRDPKWVEFPKLNKGTVIVSILSPPVGGYSVSIKAYTPTQSLTPYLALAAILTTMFTAIKRKMARKTRYQDKSLMP